MTDKATRDSPGIHVPPPLLFLGGFAAGWLLHRYGTELRFARDPIAAARLQLAGEVLLLFGILLALWGMLTFTRARTAVLPFRGASRLVTHGPYRFTRNPMYTGMTAVYVGASLAMNVVWPLLFLPVVLALLVRLVISREEAYLTREFGASYLDYRRSVRRWL